MKKKIEKLTTTKKLTTTLFFLLNKNQITDIFLKKLSDLLYHKLAEWRLISQKGDWSVKYTDSSSEKEEDLQVAVNFDEPVRLAINYFSVSRE